MRVNGFLDVITEKQAPPNHLTRGVGSLIRQARYDVGMSQQELAESMGISPRAISAIETGGREISLSEMMTLCRILRKPLLFFIPDPQRRVLEPDALSFSEFDLLMLFGRLSEDDRCKILAQMRGLVQYLQEIEE